MSKFKNVQDCDEGGAAFPRATEETLAGPYCGTQCGERGMTLRDWFAGMAMQGWLANSFSLENMMKVNNSLYSEPIPSNVQAGLTAKWSYEIADAMLKARVK